MPVYRPPDNPLLGPVTPESASADAMSMASPIGMAVARNPLNRILQRLLEQKRAAHAERMLQEMTPESLPGFPRPPARSTSPPNFTPPEVDRLQAITERWLQKVTPEQEDQMMRRFVYPRR